MIFFLFPVVGMYSFIFFIFSSFHPLFIFILSFLATATPYTKSRPHQLISQLNLTVSPSLSQPQRNRNWQKRKEKKKKQEENIQQNPTHIHTPTLSLSNSLTRSLSRQVGIETSQLSSAQLNFVIQIVKNLLRLYISLFFLGFKSNRGEILVKKPPFFT